MKSYKYFILVLVTLFMFGCSSTPDIKEVIVYKTKEVYIPVPCKVEVNCDFTGDGYIPTTKLLKCVVEQKKALEYCRQSDGS